MQAAITHKTNKVSQRNFNKPLADHPYNYVRDEWDEPTRPAPSRYQLTTSTTRLREFLVGDIRSVKHLEMPMIASDYDRWLFDAAWEGDPLMDAVVEMFNRLPSGQGRKMFLQAIDQGIDSLENPPQELVDLFVQLDHIPEWLDWEKVNDGVMMLDKASYLGIMLGVTLGSLATAGSHSISNAVGMTGRFQKNIINRSLESVAFYAQTGCKDGLRRFGPGFKAAVNVRLMHAMVRAKMVKSTEGDLFDYATYGNPMNQLDTAFGIPFFGLQIGLCEKVFGHPVSERDLEGLRMQWTYIGYLMGVRNDIVPRSAEQNFYLLDLCWATLGEPSKFTYELYEALFIGFEEAFTRHHRNRRWKRLIGRFAFDLLHAYTRYMLGNQLCDDMRAVRKVYYLRWLPTLHASVNKLVQRLRYKGQKPYKGKFTPDGGALMSLVKALLRPSSDEGAITYAHHDNLTRGS